MMTTIDALDARDVARARDLGVGETAPAMTDEQAFEAFYRETAAALRRYVVRVLGDPALADDIVQESYLRVLRARPATEAREPLRGFLFRVASNLIVDHWRRQRRERGAPDARAAWASAPGPDVPQQIDLARVFDQLRPEERVMMWLAYVEGADHREIAGALGVRRGSVRVMLHRTRRKLARLLDQLGRHRGSR